MDGRTVPYLAEYGGSDGNGVSTYMVVRPGNVTLAVDRSEVQLSGGNSDDVVWNIALDFTALGIDQIRQAWVTFAPQLTAASALLRYRVDRYVYRLDGSRSPKQEATQMRRSGEP